MVLGRLVEYGPTKNIWRNPKLAATRDSISDQFGSPLVGLTSDRLRPSLPDFRSMRR